MTPGRTVSIIIPNYNGRHLLEKNLPRVEAAAARSNPPAEIIVVDDGSSDGSPDWLRARTAGSIRSVILESNRGFAGAVLEGAKAAAGEIIYFLNSDIVVPEDLLDTLLPHFDDPDVFAVASMAYDGAGARVISSRSGLTWRFGQPDVDRSLAGTETGVKPGPTLFASGGHSAYRRDRFLEMGGFDPLFAPFYWEDVDLCYRAWKRGWKVMFEPRSAVLHDHQGTIGKITPKRDIEIIWRRNRLLFTWKNMTGAGLLARHFFMLPLQFSGARGTLPAFAAALKAAPLALERRRAAKNAATRSDRDLFEMFKEMFGGPAVCYFGAYNKRYPRNEVIRLGLDRNNIKTAEVWTPPANILSRYLKLAAGFIYRAAGCRAIIVGEGRHLDAPLARLLGALFRKKVILDAFVSHYDTWVMDRATIAPGSLRARALAFADWIGPRSAHFTLLDTNEHIKYYVEKYKLKESRFRRVLVGADDSIFKPAAGRAPDGKFHVLFYGSFLPLHGADTIIRAAKILESHKDIVFHFVGEGETLPEVKKIHGDLELKNVGFHPTTTPVELAKHIAGCDVCLGIFGATDKAARVIPNKNYEALAMRKPLITRDSPAAREILSDGELALLCPPADHAALAAAILKLKDNPGLRDSIAENGYALFKQKLTPEIIVKPIIDLL
ncbi:MAG: glycosyltransferase [bacterium]